MSKSVSTAITAAMPLTEYVAAFVLPKMHGSHAYNHRRAAQLLSIFAGFDPPCKSVTLEMLDLFEAWCKETGRVKAAPRYRRFVERHARKAGAPLAVRKIGRLASPALLIEAKEGTLWHLFETSYKRRRRSSARTSRQYRTQLNHFGKHLGHEPRLIDLSDSVLEDFMDAHAEGRSAPTANKAYWSLVALWRHASDLGLVSKRPTVQPLPEPDSIPFAWMKEEIEALLRACADVGGEIDGVPADLWWLGLHWVIWSCGERIGALLAVKRSGFDPKRGELFVPAEVRKGRRKPKLYPLLPQAVEVLAKANPFERDLLFPFPWDNATLYNRYGRILEAAGLPDDRKSKFHKMRRSFASYVEAAGGNSTTALGHSSRRVAERSYLDPRICGGQDVSKLLPALTIGGAP